MVSRPAASRPALQAAATDRLRAHYEAELGSAKKLVRAFTAALVHGLMQETGALETFSLDMRHPLSPLIAFAICLAAQDWE